MVRSAKCEYWWSGFPILMTPMSSTRDSWQISASFQRKRQQSSWVIGLLPENQQKALNSLVGPSHCGGLYRRVG